MFKKLIKWLKHLDRHTQMLDLCYGRGTYLDDDE